jgi:hypothetical protein
MSVAEPAARATADAGDACLETPPALLVAGARQFNERQFFACHETLEELWKRERRPVRELYQGILQVGVGFYHLERGNYRGAALELEWGIARLRPLPTECQGVLVGPFLAEAEAAAAALAALGPARMSEFDPRLIPTVEFQVRGSKSQVERGP